MKRIKSAHAGARFPKLLDASSRGERTTIARRRQSVPELDPAVNSNKRLPVLGAVKGIRIRDAKWAEPMTEDEIEDTLKDRY